MQEWIANIDWGWIIAGMIFTFIMLKMLTNIVAEMFFFGLTLGGIESYKYWLVPCLNFPAAPEVLYKFTAGVFLAWFLARAIWLVADQWYKPLRKVSTFIFGRSGHYSKSRQKMFGG